VDWLAFISSLVGSLTWPVTVIIIVLIFRKSLLSLAPSLRELEYGSLKLKFEEGLAKATSEAEKLPPAPLPPPDSPVKPDTFQLGGRPITQDTHILLAATAPRALVLESWIQVEDALSRAHLRLFPEGSLVAKVRATQAADQLLKANVLAPEMVKIISYLRNLRNEAAHLSKFAIEPEQALEYARLAQQIIATLDRTTQVP
jgi:hypothetical protein